MLSRHGLRNTSLLLITPRVEHAFLLFSCHLSSQAISRKTPLLHIPSASVFRFSASDAAKSVLDLNWVIHENETWAILGNATAEKVALLETLKGQTRLKPSPPGGIWPLLYEKSLDPAEHVRSVSFAHRPRFIGGGGFYDFSARYGAVRDGDAVTLRQSLLEGAVPQESSEDTLTSLSASLELKQFLDLPLVALSNGQTRRARIVRALLRKPHVLLLDEPLTGLDKQHRPRLMSLLHTLHRNQAPHIIISLRMQDPVPEWITHIALVQPGGRVITGEKAAVLANVRRDAVRISQAEAPIEKHHFVPDPQRAILADLQGVNVAYNERHILKNVTWTIREGERWILQGPNGIFVCGGIHEVAEQHSGSGKTTLLSMITGDHPQSYTQPHLHLFGVPRRRIATPTIARRIGICSPELYNAFPRRFGPQGLTVRDAITSGFDGVFTYRKPTAEQTVRVDSLLAELGPSAWSENAGPSVTENFGNRIFADLTAGEQSLVLLLRAIVNDPSLLILDEALSGMDLRMVDVTRKYLRKHFGSGEKKTIIWVSHWDSEAPWGVEDDVQKYSLENGVGTQLIL